MITAKRLSHTWETRLVQSESGCQNASTFSMNVVALSKAPAFLRLMAPYYLGINFYEKTFANKLWLKSSAMGQNKLNGLMKTMAEKGGLSSKRLTIHSARKRMIQKLNDSDMPPGHLMQLSGHGNIQSINNYSHISQQQQKNMSRILSATSTERATKLHRALATESEAKNLSCSFQSSSSPTMHGASVFSGAVFHGGHFKISTNTVNQSPNANSATRKHTFKRVKRILLDSSDEDSPPLQLTILTWLHILSSYSCL